MSIKEQPAVDHECGSSDCEAFASFRFRWPGKDWLDACLLCANRACALAQVFSFTLQIEQLPEQPWQKEIRLAIEAQRVPKLIVD